MMSRAKGTANLAASLEVLAGAPLDAREKVPTKADLYIAANFPYPYVGLETYVVSENKKYRLVGNDVTVEANWQEVGSGGGGADTEIIADDFDPTESYAVGDYVVYEGTLYKCTTAHTGAWDASDFDATLVMEEMPTPMPASDMSEVVTPLPSVMSRRFKYSTEEQIVGEWIDGKPLYQKVIIGNTPASTAETIIYTGNTGDVIKSIEGSVVNAALNYYDTSNWRVKTSCHNNIIIMAVAGFTNTPYVIIIQYTKTTD